jgi:hypothetical protein
VGGVDVTVDLLEFAVVVLAGIVIVAVVYELTRLELKRRDDAAEAADIEQWRRTHRW